MLFDRVKVLLRSLMAEGVFSLARAFREASKRAESGSMEFVDSAMSELLQQTGARAVGWWRRVGEELHQLSFQAASDMPTEVRSGFVSVTGCVPLTRIELGCVRAAAELRPIVAREDAARRGLEGSASWLARFRANQSLALPIIKDGIATGVLAIATADEFGEDSAIWATMAAIVSELSSAAA